MPRKTKKKNELIDITLEKDDAALVLRGVNNKIEIFIPDREDDKLTDTGYITSALAFTLLHKQDVLDEIMNQWDKYLDDTLKTVEKSSTDE